VHKAKAGTCGYKEHTKETSAPNRTVPVFNDPHKRYAENQADVFTHRSSKGSNVLAQRWPQAIRWSILLGNFGFAFK